MSKKLNVLAIITARLNSKRVRQKNIKLFFGKPLIYWTILNAKKSKYIDEILLSTESKKIAKVASKYGCKAPFLRPKYLSRDNVEAHTVALHAYKKINKRFDYIILLQPTSPLRTNYHIDTSIKILIKKRRSSLISICKSKTKGKFPIRKDDQNFYHNVNGAIYIAKSNYLIKRKNFLNKDSVLFNMPKKSSIDVDSLNDFNEAKRYFKKTF